MAVGKSTPRRYSTRKFGMLSERFWPKVQKSGPDDCWLWIAATNRGGYGVIRNYTGRTEIAHRVSWELAHGPIPDGLFACHSCDNPPCVNPAHLFLGTIIDNQRDSIQKGRHARGERSRPISTLTDEKVRAIRARFAATGETRATIAADYNVSRSIIVDVISRKTWRHVI